jgi:AGCS family alanine or glycine:cation symporter
LTALVIIFTGVYETNPELNGAPLTSSAFATVFPWFPYLLVVAIFLFAFSTMISWSYYGQQGFLFLSSKYIKNTKIPGRIYQILFLFFVVLGAATDLTDVITFSDMMILGLAFPNILGLLFMVNEIKQDLATYLKKKN